MSKQKDLTIAVTLEKVLALNKSGDVNLGSSIYGPLPFVDRRCTLAAHHMTMTAIVARSPAPDQFFVFFGRSAAHLQGLPSAVG